MMAILFVIATVIRAGKYCPCLCLHKLMQQFRPIKNNTLLDHPPNNLPTVSLESPYRLQREILTKISARQNHKSVNVQIIYLTADGGNPNFDR